MNPLPLISVIDHFGLIATTTLCTKESKSSFHEGIERAGLSLPILFSMQLFRMRTFALIVRPLTSIPLQLLGAFISTALHSYLSNSQPVNSTYNISKYLPVLDKVISFVVYIILFYTGSVAAATYGIGLLAYNTLSDRNYTSKDLL